jgi:hypothetical protein
MIQYDIFRVRITLSFLCKHTCTFLEVVSPLDKAILVNFPVFTTLDASGMDLSFLCSTGQATRSQLGCFLLRQSHFYLTQHWSLKNGLAAHSAQVRWLPSFCRDGKKYTRKQQARSLLHTDGRFLRFIFRGIFQTIAE